MRVRFKSFLISRENIPMSFFHGGLNAEETEKLIKFSPIIRENSFPFPLWMKHARMRSLHNAPLIKYRSVIDEIFFIENTKGKMLINGRKQNKKIMDVKNRKEKERRVRSWHRIDEPGGACISDADPFIFPRFIHSPMFTRPSNRTFCLIKSCDR